MEYLIKILQIVAWPIVVVAVVAILRKPLGFILQSLTHLRYKNLDLYFEHSLSKAESKAKEKLPPLKDKLKEDSIVESPRAAIVEAWINLETEIFNTAQRLSIELPKKANVGRVFQSLVNVGKIDPDIKGIFNRVRELRNTAAHELDLDLNIEEAQRYKILIQQIIQALESIQ